MEGGPVNGNSDGETRWAVQVVVEFDQSIFRHFRVGQWNEFAAELVRCCLTPVAWSKGEQPSPIGVMFDFSGLRATHCRLDSIDLTFCDLDGANLEGSSLKGAKVGDCPRAKLRRTWLQGASFRGDVSAADFTDARIEGTDFSDAHYLTESPPLGLPPDAMAAIECIPSDQAGSKDDPFMPPVNVKAVIHEVPW
jgi:hypothetical protein